MNFFARLVLAVLFIPFANWSGSPAAAQTANTGIVLGTVSDKGAAVVPDATVDLTNSATNDTKTATSNSSGQYVFPSVAPGTYTLKFAKAGFAHSCFTHRQDTTS